MTLTKHIPKGYLLQQAGETHTKVYWVKKGLLRSYTIDAKGKEHIFVFGPEGWLVADSCPADLPCELYIDALEDSEVVVMEKELSQESVHVEKILKRIHVLQQRVLMLMSTSAMERYEHFLNNYPHISQRVPQRMIASYLGITPEALSKIKREEALRK